MSGWTLLNNSPMLLAAAAIAAAVAIASGYGSARHLPVKRKLVLTIVRLLVVVSLFLALLRPAKQAEVFKARRPPLAVVVDASSSMTLGTGATVAGSAVEWLKSNRSALKDFSEVYDVGFYLLGEGVERTVPENFDGPEDFTAQRTELSAGLASLGQTFPGLAGVVLLSDGRDTEVTGDAPVSVPFPVYPVTLPSSQTKDLWIERVERPPVGFIRTPVEIKVKLGTTNYEDRPVVVTLFEDDKVLGSAESRVTGGRAEAYLSFTPRRTGKRAYRVEVSRLENEATGDNNWSGFSLNVIRDKTRVLLVSGTPTWDAKFLRRRLRQDPSIDLISFMILRTGMDLTTVPQNELSLIPFPTKELFDTELDSFDAVIFVNFDYLPYVQRNFLDNLSSFVREAGGGFAMIGGDRSFGLGGYYRTSLAEVLPVSLSGGLAELQYIYSEFKPRMTREGEVHPLFTWKSTAEENRQLWEGLPNLKGMNWVLKPKPDAIVLAENPEARNEFGSLPLVTLGEFGSGRTMAIATDELWRWALPNVGRGGDGAVYRDFWTRALRWLVHDPEMELVRLAPPPVELRAGDGTTLGARVLDRSYKPVTGAKLSGKLIDPEGVITELAWEERVPSEYGSVEFAPDKPGVWRVELKARLGTELLGVDGMGFAVLPESPEPLRVGVDREYLEKLAAASGGRVYDVGDGSLFDDLIREGREDLELAGMRVEEVWPTGWALIALIVLMAADWGLRRLWE